MSLSRFAFALLILLQFGLFWQYAKREVVWAYPGNYDQTAYLTADAMLYHDILHRGPGPAIKHYLHQPPPTGFMLPLQDSIFHFFAGPGRLTNLSLNFFYFVLLQAAFFTTARWLSGHALFGWLSVGLLMMQQTAFLGAGGLFDCRIDFIVYSLYGIFVCFLVRSEGLRNLRWLAASVGCAMLLVSFRFITFSYLLGFSCTLVTGLFGLRLLFRRARAGQRLFLKLALGRAVALLLVFFALGGTIIYRNWRSIHDYYVVGHLTGNEKHIRAIEMGVKNLADHCTFYFAALFREHFGTSFVLVASALVLLSLLVGILRRVTPPSLRGSTFQVRWLIELLIIGASIFAPWFILTLDESKSALVAGALAPPCALLLVSLAARFAQSGESRRAAYTVVSQRLVPVWWSAAAGLVLALGIGNWLHHLARQGNYSARRASVEQILALHDYINEQSRQRGFVKPLISTDLMREWNIPPAINVSILERTGTWLGARISFGYTVYALSREEVLAGLEQGDVTMISTFPKVGPYPIVESIRPMAREISAWCDSHLLRGRVFEIDDGQVTVYFRPNVDLEGLSGEWLTPTGNRLHVPGVLLDAMRTGGKNVLVLEGPRNTQWLKQAPVLHAQLIGVAGVPPGTPFPAEFVLPQPGLYQLRFDFGSVLSALPPGSEAVITLQFEGASFYPPDVGIDDPRHLVVTKPISVRLD